MERFICKNVFVPLRSGPSHKSEMLSQILFGEKYITVEKIGHWMKVETQFDKYRGWIDMDHLQHCADTESESGYVLNRALICFKNDRTKMTLEAGCEIYNPDFEKKEFTIERNKYNTENEFSKNYITTNETLADIAMKFINCPYIWGGRIPSGIDCSGLTQLVYKIYGKKIPRNSWDQSAVGKDIDFIDESQSGDLVFFDDEKGRISHVGMIVSGGLVIHASGRVKVDSIDHQGIFNREKGDYSHHLRKIKRIIN
jgi:gamma-D-glutamyl-L-lysine dipeptidyl-peptidase